MRPTHFTLPAAALVLAALAPAALAKTVKVEPGPGTPLADAVATLEDGDKLVLASGDYAERLLLIGLDDVTIVGKGKANILGDGTAATVFINSCTNLTVKKIGIGRTDNDGLSIAGSSGVTVKHVTVSEAASDAFRVTLSEDVTLSKCTVLADAEQVGTKTGLTASDVDRLRVLRCSFGAGLGRGISMSTSDVAPVRDSEVSKCRFEGITIQAMLVGGANLACTKNRFGGCDVGIRTTGTGTFSMSIQKNRFVRMTGQSVVIQNPFVRVDRNKFVQCEGLAISGSQNGPDAQITNNVVKDIAIAGIIVSGQRSVVRGNKISGVIGATTRALAAQGTEAVFEKNVVKKNEGDGLRITMGGNTFRNNTIQKNGATDVASAVAEDQNTFEDNRFGTVSFP